MAYLSFFSSLGHFFVAVALGGSYLSLFLVTLFEGVPLIGILVPGHVAIIAAGFLSSIGVLNVFVVILVTAVGAIAGDYLSFLLGRRYGWPLIDRLRRYFFIKDKHIAKAKSLLAAHTGKALIIGRFNPVTRGIMPFIVGANKAPAGAFWIYNGLGALLWIVASVGFGYIIGFGYHAAAGLIGQIVLVAVIVALLIIWGYRFINVRFHIFRRYELIALSLNLVSLYVLSRMIQDALSEHSFLAAFDVWVNGLMGRLEFSLHGPLYIAIATWTSSIGGIESMLIASILVSMFLAFRRRWRSAAIMLSSLWFTALSVGWMKEFFMRTRPQDLLVQNLFSDPSFPSAHAAFAATFFAALAYLFLPRIRSWVWREIVLVACVLVVIAIGLSRLVLNVHWASDVIAGWSLGVFSATGAILFVRYLGTLLLGKTKKMEEED